MNAARAERPNNRQCRVVARTGVAHALIITCAGVAARMFDSAIALAKSYGANEVHCFGP